jgi:hypothetical protein
LYIAGRKEEVDMFRHTKLLSTTIILLSVVLNDVSAQGNAQDEEILRYRVSWGMIRLGTITIRTSTDSLRSHGAVRVSMLVESNPGLFFIKLREYNESLIDAESCFSREYFGDFRFKGKRELIRTAFNPDLRRAWYIASDPRTGAVKRSIQINDSPEYVDGPSLIHFTRSHAHRNEILTVATMVSGEIRNTVLDFSGGHEKLFLPALNKEVYAKRYSGTADWKGGTSQDLFGAFTGWITPDEDAVILRAEMKISVGTIRIELEEWQKPGWDPVAADRVP